MRGLEDVGGEWRLIAPMMDYVLWRGDGSEMAYTQNETTMSGRPSPGRAGRALAHGRILGPAGCLLARRTLSRRVGQQAGEWEYGCPAEAIAIPLHAFEQIHLKHVE